jgi:phosphonate degradation associated HDIG domain protein
MASSRRQGEKVAMQSELNAETIVPFIADIFERRGAEAYLGEPVSLSQHMLQAAHLAEQDGAPDALVVAALLHDIGHFTSSFGTYTPDDREDRHHDEAGATVLEPFFPPIVIACVRLHVAAKRYLCATDTSYFSQLSPASVHTLSLQGGPMNDEEVAQFRANPFHQAAVRVRRFDEASKVPGMPTRAFRDYVPLLESVVMRQQAPPLENFAGKS